MRVATSFGLTPDRRLAQQRWPSTPPRRVGRKLSTPRRAAGVASGAVRAPRSSPIRSRYGRRGHGLPLGQAHVAAWLSASGGNLDLDERGKPLGLCSRPRARLDAGRRSAASSASRRASSRNAVRLRRRAAASRSAVRTACESFRPSALTTSSAAGARVAKSYMKSGCQSRSARAVARWAGDDLPVETASADAVVTSLVMHHLDWANSGARSRIGLLRRSRVPAPQNGLGNA